MDNKFESIATKVSKEQMHKLKVVLRRLGTNIYDWFQRMAEVTIRMADDRHNLSERMSKIIQLFELVPGWRNPVTFFDPNAECEVDGAVYFVKQKGKKGLKVVMERRDWFDGEWHETENVMDILEALIEICMPKSYKWLRQRLVDYDCNRVFELILRIADDAKAEYLDDEINNMFNDNNRHDWGKEIEYGERTKRVKSRKVEEYIKQGTLNFEANEERQADAAEASAWVESAEGKDWLNNIDEEYDGLG